MSSEDQRLRRTEVERQKEAYGGVRVGSAFVGWLTATAAAVLLTALVAAACAAVGVSTTTDASATLTAASANARTVGITSAVILLVILLVVIAVAVAVIAAVAGSKDDVLSTLNSFPRIPADGGTRTKGGVAALVVVAAASLAGTLLGGLAGMRHHQRRPSWPAVVNAAVVAHLAPSPSTACRRSAW